MAELILGGARSGKSRYAQQCTLESGKEVVYIATATAGDAEMAARIEQHRRDRPKAWKTVEEPIALANTLQKYAAPQRCLLVDCLTLWLSNLLLEQNGEVAELLFGLCPRPLAKVHHPSPWMGEGRGGGERNQMEGQEVLFQRERQALFKILPTLPGRILMVSNEVGMGIVPTSPLVRRFIDEAGTLHQDLARICTRVVWVMAGIPQILKQV